jgi:hypothetical protein
MRSQYRQSLLVFESWGTRTYDRNGDGRRSHGERPVEAILLSEAVQDFPVQLVSFPIRVATVAQF